jgi:hypothetical protein
MIEQLKSFCTRALLALALAGGANAACAGPMLHVTVDTTSLSGAGYLDLTFAALAGAAPATATLTHVDGAFGTIGAALALDNSATFNELLQPVTFGGLLGFDVRFDIADTGTIGTSFGVALVNATLDDYAPGTSGNVAQVDLMPGQPAAIWADDAFATVNPVPEPADVPLFATGLMLVALDLRRRPRS